MNDRTPQNITWNFHSELPELDNYRNESYISDDSHVIEFDYNGYKIEAQLSYNMTLETAHSEGGSDEYGNGEMLVDVSVKDIELDLITMFYNDGEDFKVPLREFNEIQNELLIDLKIQY